MKLLEKLRIKKHKENDYANLTDIERGKLAKIIIRYMHISQKYTYDYKDVINNCSKFLKMMPLFYDSIHLALDYIETYEDKITGKQSNLILYCVLSTNILVIKKIETTMEFYSLNPFAYNYEQVVDGLNKTEQEIIKNYSINKVSKKLKKENEKKLEHIENLKNEIEKEDTNSDENAKNGDNRVEYKDERVL